MARSSCTEETLMMRPGSPWATIRFAAAWQPSHAPVRLTAMVSCHTSKGVSRKGILRSMPALLPRVRDVRPDHEVLAACPFYLFSHLLGRVLAPRVVDDQGGPFPGE